MDIRPDAPDTSKGYIHHAYWKMKLTEDITEVNSEQIGKC